MIAYMQKIGCELTKGLIGAYHGITLIYGEASTGKTTLAKMAAIEYSKQGKVIFLDTENGFNTDRLRQLTSNFNDVLKSIILINAKNFFQQHQAIKNMGSIKKVSLIIVDTIGANYRVYVKNDYKKANAILKTQINALKKIGEKIPVLIITQVYSDLKSGLLNPIGGKIVTNDADTIIRLEKKPRKIII